MIIASAKKKIVTQLTKVASLVDRLKAKDENIQQLKRDANTAAMVSDALRQELKREQERYVVVVPSHAHHTFLISHFLTQVSMVTQ